MTAERGEVPRQLAQRPVTRFVRRRVEVLEPAAEVVDEVELAPAVTRRLDRGVMPLQHALRVGERSVLLRMGGAGKEEDLGRYVLGCNLTPVDLRRLAPELRRLRGSEIAHHEPFERA